MSGMTSYLQKKLLDDFFGVAAFTPPSPVYLSLHTGTLSDVGSHANEVSGGSYARQSLATKIGAADATSGVAVNTGTVTFGPATASWGTIVAIGFEDALTVGNMCLWGLSSESKNIGSGQSFPFVASQLSIKFD